MENNVFSKYLGKRVKAVFKDKDITKVVIGILNEVNDKYLIIDEVMVGLGDNFIFCIPQEGNNEKR
jgi:hypothetical protein